MPGPETYPDDLLYNSDHDWARIEGEEATFGITWYAQDQLGEIVFVDGAKVGAQVRIGEAYIELESVKAVSEVIAPLSGEIVAVNEAAVEAPDRVNSAPYGEGWLVRVRIADPAEAEQLLDAAAYHALLQPGDRAMGLSLDHGGHLTHGMKLNVSGRLYEIHPYGVREDTGLIDPRPSR